MAKQNIQELSITVSKDENMSEWYTQLVQKAELISYSAAAGLHIYRPDAFQIWELIQSFFDERIKSIGVKNCYFPMLIPESLLIKEANHVDGFAPEVVWATQGGETKFKQKLAIRPTSETIMYDTYKDWIKSYRDLPLRLNQWNSVMRWEKLSTPFIRPREFLWQEGHTVFETKKEAMSEVLEILEFYRQIYEDLLAVPVNTGRKSIGEKFAGADYSSTCETFLSDGKAIQGCTSHQLGQNFAKAFGIEFLDKNQKKQFPWQNSWGFSVRGIGVMIMTHGDDKGLILPPRVANNKLVIIPLLFKGKEELVLKELDKLNKELDSFNPIVDDRKEYSPGFKYNEWELKGIPLRLELGPRDVENKKCIVVRRDTGEKIEFKLDKTLKKNIENLLEQIHKDMFDKAKKSIDENTVDIKNFKEFEKAIENKKRCLVAWAESEKSEDEIKEKTGAKSSCIPFEFKDKSLKGINCFYSGKPATCWAYFCKSH
jgi:prolyl-tRNA synthetase